MSSSHWPGPSWALSGCCSTDEQWATLQAVFPDGVCDWSLTGQGQGPAETWLRYDAAHGGVRYGGRNLPAVPKHSAGGVVSGSWASMLRK